MRAIARRWPVVVVGLVVVIALLGALVFRTRVIEVTNSSTGPVTNVTIAAFGGKHGIANIKAGETVRWSFRGLPSQGLVVAWDSGSGMRIEAMSDVVGFRATHLQIRLRPGDRLDWESSR
jgi:hypothetical protein